jgi:hypothetical protein
MVHDMSGIWRRWDWKMTFVDTMHMRPRMRVVLVHLDVKLMMPSMKVYCWRFAVVVVVLVVVFVGRGNFDYTNILLVHSILKHGSNCSYYPCVVDCSC